ncbi:MAG: hypothetical protein H7222_15160 [Methylotenera sp.]|nr:hypothetical protein [Oligoflexia bacterium]
MIHFNSRSAVSILMTLFFLTAVACNSSTGESIAADPSASAPVSGNPTQDQKPISQPTAPSGATPVVTPAPLPGASPASKPIALVYGGPGVLPGPGDTLDMAKSVAAKAGFKVIEVTQFVDSEILDSASVWVQPGGPNLSADSYMNANGMADQVRNFVTRGGGYVGFCGGAFSAVNNLELIAGSAWNLDEATGKIPVKWLGATRYMHFEHGPYLQLSDKSAEVVATYADGSTAAARSHYGKGEVFISGVHPEADQYWQPTYDPDGLDQDLAITMLREVAKRPDPSTGE